ncbi:hypothetical protein E4U32_001633 [Claviceps aff. humidiphila group G2b]|nr:hypothetical protein E4U32_001633 [Claviceps aff. humidiphila group G2b]
MARPTASASRGRSGGDSNDNDSDGSDDDDDDDTFAAAFRAHTLLCLQRQLMGKKHTLSRLGRVLRRRLDMLLESALQEAQGQLFYEGAHGFPHVIVCLDGSYCCDTDGPQCCAEKRGVFLDVTGNIAKVAASTMLSWGPERTSSGYQTADTSDTDSAASATPPPESEATSASPREAATGTGPSRDPGTSSTPSTGESDNTALKIGVGVGVPLGVLALGACAALIVVLRRSRRRRSEMGAAEAALAKQDGKRRDDKSAGGLVPGELDATSVHRAELPP